MLVFYIGTVVICYSANLLVIKSLKKEAKKLGYEFKTEQNKTKFNSFLNQLKLFSISAIPIFNLILVNSVIAIEKEMKNSSMEEMIKDGTLIKIEEDNISDIDEKSINEKVNVSFNDNKINISKNSVNEFNYYNNDNHVKQKIKRKRR